MTTPAQEAGFILNVTRLKLTRNDGDYSSFNSRKEKVWILESDNGSHCPYFKAEDGSDRVFRAYVSDMTIIQEGPKFPIGSNVVVVSAGWGFGPDKIGQVFKVEDFTLRGTEKTTYKVVDSEGQLAGGEIWEPTFELAPVAPALTVPVELPSIQPPAALPVYTELQQKAINTFQGMYDAAVLYRQGLDSRLNGDYGICDNIDRFASAASAREGQMSEVKENFIRQTAIYSGNYTYPVPCPEGGDASNAFSRNSNKWRGAYGLNRLVQLEQLIELIKTKWDDSMVNRKTPAFRNGLKVGDVVSYVYRDTPTFWVFRRDDESMSPSFHKLTDKDDYTDLDLNYIRKLDKDTISKPRAVSEFLSDLEEQAKKKADIDRQIAELQKQLQGVQTEIAMLDYGLASQHKVKRI